MKPPEICVSITGKDRRLVEKAEPFADLFEVRIDLIGKGWRDVASTLEKPWIACNRRAAEGGKWTGSRAERLKELDDAVGLGARIVDIELGTPGIEDIVKSFKSRAEVLVSYHDFKRTPSLDSLRQIIGKQLAAGADICKVVTVARSFRDNVNALRLISLFPAARIVSFCMGEAGRMSRILSPLAGGYFTYASLAAGKESADGQVTAAELREIYRMLEEK